MCWFCRRRSSEPTAGGGDGGGGATVAAQKLNLDVERRPRSSEEMAQEASELRALFPV